MYFLLQNDERLHYAGSQLERQCSKEIEKRTVISQTLKLNIFILLLTQVVN